MEFDNFYLFKSKDLKKDVTYEMVPYDHLIDISSCLSMSYVEGNNFGIKFEYFDKYLVLFFRNIIECTKFYIYGKILHYNQIERNNSFQHTIEMNIRILFDDQKFNQMENVLLVVIDQHATEEAKKNTGDDDEGSKNLLQSVAVIYERLMICFYSMKNP